MANEVFREGLMEGNKCFATPDNLKNQKMGPKSIKEGQVLDLVFLLVQLQLLFLGNQVFLKSVNYQQL